MKKFCMGLLLAGCALAAQAQQSFEQLDIGRGDARLPVYVMSEPQAKATLILLPGGDAGTGAIVDGMPKSGNFLSRSRSLFKQAGYNVMVVYRPSDLKALDYDYRISAPHIHELRVAVEYAKQAWGRPVWLIGTSRGTVSGTAAAIALGPELVSGLVLTSSVTNSKAGAIATQNLKDLKIPVLVVHHSKDACKVCKPDEAAQITQWLIHSPRKDFILVDGGSDPRGNVCDAQHWHGFIQYEPETVKLITDWLDSQSGR
jgi:pimeloyl-ACP methyl ester carboxylesterase